MSDKPRKFWQLHLSTALFCTIYVAIAMGPAMWWYQEVLQYYTWEGDTKPLFPWVQPVALGMVAVFLTVPTLLLAFGLEFLIRRRSKP